MSRLVMYLGILLIVIGGAGIAFGALLAPAFISDTATRLSDPKAADFCNPGEQLVTETGPESYSYSQGYSHSQTYYCVNQAGQRRDVTVQVAKNFISDFLPTLGSLLIPILSGGLCTLGFAFAVIGFVFSRRRRLQTVDSQLIFTNPTTPRAVGSSLQFNFTDPGAPSVIGNPASKFIFPDPSAPPATHALDDLAAKLAQLEEAHNSGLITDEEYQRKRQEILDAPS